MNSCDTIAVASGSLSTSTPLQSKMTTSPPIRGRNCRLGLIVGCNAYEWAVIEPQRHSYKRIAPCELSPAESVCKDHLQTAAFRAGRPPCGGIGYRPSKEKGRPSGQPLY